MRTSFKVSAVLATLLLLSLPLVADMYKWIDENGKVHYTDSPAGEEGEETRPENQLHQRTAGRLRFQELHFRRGVPVILVGNQRTDDYSESTLAGLLKQAGL